MKECLRAALAVVLLVALVPIVSAQQGLGSDCTIAGTWYGGSVVAYQMTITPSGPAGLYTIMAQGMYKNAVLNTVYTGELTKKGNNYYEGSMMQLSTSDPDFLNPPPIGKMPDIFAGWSQVEMLDCSTFKSTIPMFGIYFASNIWEPGVNWLDKKTPLVDPPDVDLIDVLGGGKPIIETYHRLTASVNPTLKH